MIQVNKIGVYLDYTHAHMLELTIDSHRSKTIESNFSSHDIKEALSKGENHMHNKENKFYAIYFRNIMDYIIHYNEILIFGPTHAKDELFNMIKQDYLFSNKIIDVSSSDQLDSKEQYLFISNFYKHKMQKI